MSLTSTDNAAARPATVAGTCPGQLTRSVRAQVSLGLGWPKTAERVVNALRGSLPDVADLLPANVLDGDPAGYRSHLLHAEPDGSFSIVAMVWRPGQETVIHDHVAWCVTGVLQGCEYEEVFSLAEDGRALRLAGRTVNPGGSVSGFAPPGDIHRVRNTGDGVAISMHVYGADISRLGTSVRREYEIPVLA